MELRGIHKSGRGIRLHGQLSPSRGDRSSGKQNHDQACRPRRPRLRDDSHLRANFAEAWLALLSDSPCGAKPARVQGSFKQRLLDDTRGVVLHFSDLSHQLVSQTTLTGSGTLIGEWIPGFKDTPVFFEYNRFFHSGDPNMLGWLYTFLNFGKKMEWHDPTFHEVAFRDWIGIEQELSDLEFVQDDVTSLSTILHRLLTPLSDHEFWPRHGPGSVAERGLRDPVRKHNMLSYDRILDHVFFTGPYSSFGLREEYGYSADRVLPDPDLWKPERLVKRRPAWLMFVDKNLKTARSVCMEPAELMYFQQGVARQATDVIDATPFSRFIRLRDQTRNQRLCLIGSYTGEIDTIDLSAASDRLSVELVRRIFPASWKIPMLATRSSVVRLPDGSERVIKKFAPMGSAMCFPTQCIVFASVCIYAAHLWSMGRGPLESDVMSAYDVRLATNLFRDEYVGYVYKSKRLHPLAVYGDDICCDYRLTPFVTAILGRLGFQVNITKSFTGAQAFRESCGVFAWNGHDISPLYYRVKGGGAKLNAPTLSSQVHLANESWRRGFRHLYRWVLRKLMDGTSKPVPFIRDTSADFGIFAKEPRNKHLLSRVNQDLQRTEYRVWTIVPRDSIMPDFRHERYLLMRWKSYRHDEDGLPSSHVYSHSHKVKWRWTPLY